MKNKYFYMKQENEIRGPFLASTLDKLYSAGTVPADILISADKQSWSTLKDTLYKSRDQVDAPELHPVALPCSEETVASHNMSENVPEQLQNAAAVPLFPVETNRSALSGCATMSGKKDSLWEVAGETLHLIWNTPDKLDSMVRFSVQNIYRIFFPVCLLFTLLISQAAAISVAFFWGHCLQKSIFILLFTLVAVVLFFLEIMLLSLKDKNGFRDRFLHVVILAGMSWINFGVATCVGVLHFALFLSVNNGGMPMWVSNISAIFFLFVCCFSFSNMAAGLRIGLCSFFGFRPRNAVWSSALFLWQYFLLLYAGFLFAKKFFV